MRLTAVLLAAAALFSIAIGRSAINSSEPNDVHVAAYWDPSVTAGDNEWYKAVEKGARLTCRLDANDEAAGRLWKDTRTPPSARSEWADTQLTHDLNYWGWRESDWDQAYVCDYSDDDSNDHIHKIGTCLTSLDLSAKPISQGGDNLCFSIQHYDEDAVDHDGDQLEPDKQYYDANGKSRRFTGAYVRFGVNQKDGILFGHAFESPKTAAIDNWRENPTEDELPKLKKASDIMTAFWLRGHSNPTNLRYYLVFTVQNEQTVPLVARILKGAGFNEVPYWPGLTVGMWDQEGQALLGSPLGSTLAFMLAQHKAELGHKHVTEVTIFRDNFPQNVMPAIQLLYTIKDVPDVSDSGASHVRRDGPKNVIRTHRFDALTGGVVRGGV